MNNDKISELYKKIEAQDKIINTQALEIARLKEQNAILNQTQFNQTMMIQENVVYKEKIDKAIEYIQKRFEINEYGEYYFTHTFDNSNMKELLEILEGDKE